MDSRVVTREIRRHVWTRLKPLGFDQFTARTAWRHSDSRIDVVNFQSFNSYLAGAVGCTTYSFALNLGCYISAIPWEYARPLKQKGALLLPEEFQCHLRLHLDKSISQPELPRANIWLIGESGEYLPDAVSDASGAILERGLPWFRQMGDYDFLLQQLTTDKTPIWSTGTRSSPKRSYLVGYLALAQGRPALAVQHLRLALDSGCFKAAEARLRETLRKLTE